MLKPSKTEFLDISSIFVQHICLYLYCLFPNQVNRKFQDITAELSTTSSATGAATLRQRAEAVPWELRGTKEFNQLRCLIADSIETRQGGSEGSWFPWNSRFPSTWCDLYSCAEHIRFLLMIYKWKVSSIKCCNWWFPSNYQVKSIEVRTCGEDGEGQ